MLKEPYAPRFLGHLFDLVRTAMHSAYRRIKLVKRRISICIILPLTKPVLTAVKTTTKITVAAANKKTLTGAPRRSPTYPTSFGAVGEGLAPPKYQMGLFVKKSHFTIPQKLLNTKSR